MATINAYGPSAEVLTVFETVPSMYLILSKELIILTASDVYLDATNKSREAIKGRFIFDVFPLQQGPDESENLHASLQEVISTGKPHQMPVVRFDIADPQNNSRLAERYWHTAHTPIMDRDGKLSYIIHHTRDVTERVLAEKQLKISLERQIKANSKSVQLSKRIEKLFLEIPARIAILSGPEFVYEFINPQYHKLFGNRNLLGQKLLEAVPELKGHQIISALQQVYRTGESFEANELCIPLIGFGGVQDERYFNLIYQARLDEHGKINGILSFAYDVTELVLARKSIDHSRHNLILLNKDLQEANEKILASNEELSAINEELSVTNEELCQTQSDLQVLNSKLEERVEKRTKEAFLALKQAEASERRFGFLLNAMPQQVWTARADGTLDFVNQVVCDDFGKPAEEIIGHGMHEFIHPNDLEASLIAWKTAIERGVEYMAEFRLQMQDGHYKWHLGRAIPLNENGQVKLWMGTNTNIDIQKNNEQKKDEFLSIASHELKTPLTSIKAFNQLMKRITGDDKLGVFVKKSEEQIYRLEKLISDLLDVTKINAGKMKYTMEEFSFGKMLADSIENVQHTAPSHKIILAEVEEVLYIGDKIRIEQVVNNFLTNAIKYSPGGEQVIVNCIKDLDSIVVSVRDFGIGIADKDMQHLFERYYRVDNKEMQFEGLGLGLFISSEILKRHRGSFWIESEPGKGSIFYFRLPLSGDEPKAIVKDSKYYKDNAITIIYNEKYQRLDIDWTGYQTYQTVQRGGMLVLDMIAKNKVYKIVNDNTNVLGTWSEAIDWVGTEWYPMAEKAGLRYLAWVYSPGAFGRLSAQKSMDVAVGTIVTQLFTNTSLAEHWINDK